MKNRVPVLLDWDGVVNVLGVGAEGLLDRGLVPHDVRSTSGRVYRNLIDPTTSELLRQLRQLGELVWATSWANANTVLSPLVGLPTDLDQVPYVQPSVADALLAPWHPKLPAIRQWIATRGADRVVWIDDTAAPDDRADLLSDFGGQPASPMIQYPPPAHALVVTPEPHVGLTQEHVDQVRKWLEQLG